MTAYYRGVSIIENLAPPIVVGFSYMAKTDTTTCDACSTHYVSNNYKDRCPVCFPVQAREDGALDKHEQADGENDDDD